MTSEQDIREIEDVKNYLHAHTVSIVAVKNGVVIGSIKGKGIKPFLDLIQNYNTELDGCVIGDRILGKASALLCRYINAKVVYAMQGTKKAIATLIVGGIVNQVDDVIYSIKNKTEDGVCPFEQLLADEDDPKRAYQILYEKIMNP